METRSWPKRVWTINLMCKLLGRRHCAGPPKCRQLHRSQPPRDGEVQFESAVCTHCARPPSRPRKWR
eukprot:9169944-Pyramimonas_sp.AAC.1